MPNTIQKRDYSEYFEETNALMYCLEVLLRAMGWHGNRRTIIESFPHFSHSLSLPQFLKIMRDYHFIPSEQIEIKNNLNPSLLPCLLMQDGNFLVVIKKHNDGWQVFDGESQQIEIKKDIQGQIISFKKQEDSEQHSGYTSKALRQYKSEIYKVFIISFFISLLSLAQPFYNMFVYDRVTISSSYGLLFRLTIGILICLFGSVLLQHFRNRLISFISSSIDLIISDKIFDQIIRLPYSKIESASLGNQVSKIKEFDQIRDFLSGPMVGTLAEAPFTLIYFAAVYFLAGYIVLVPVVGLFLLGLMLLISKKNIQKVSTKTNQSTSKRQEFIIETFNNLDQVKTCGLEKTWQDRFKKLSGKASTDIYKSSTTTATIQNAADFIVNNTLLISIVMSVFSIINHQLSIGGLIAILLLVSRIMNPVKVLLTNLSRLMQLKNNFQQILSLLSMPLEEDISKHRIVANQFKGKIVFDRVTHRYNEYSQPALINVNFTIQPGELVMIKGPNGSGKSTIFHLIEKLYQPIVGSVMLDDKDVRQINSYELRQNVAFIPAQVEFFYGTIRQNLKMANPIASEQDLLMSIKWADLEESINKLPDGLDTRMTDRYQTMFSSSFLSRLAIARALIKKPGIILISETLANLDQESEQRILKNLLNLRGRVTIMMITHRPSHLKFADTILSLNNGICQVMHNNEKNLNEKIS